MRRFLLTVDTIDILFLVYAIIIFYKRCYYICISNLFLLFNTSTLKSGALDETLQCFDYIVLPFEPKKLSNIIS